MRVELGDNRRQSVAGQAVDRAGHFLANILRSTFDIAFQHKRAGNVRKAFEGINVDFVNPTDGGDGIFERQNHSGYDLFGSRPRQPHFDVYGSGVCFGKKVNGQPTVGEGSEGHEKSNQHHREDGILDAGFGKLHLVSRLVERQVELDLPQILLHRRCVARISASLLYDGSIVQFTGHRHGNAISRFQAFGDFKPPAALVFRLPCRADLPLSHVIAV